MADAWGGAWGTSWGQTWLAAIARVVRGDDAGPRQSRRYRPTPEDIIRIVEMIEAEKAKEQDHANRQRKRRQKRRIEKAAAQVIQTGNPWATQNVAMQAAKQAAPVFSMPMSEGASSAEIEAAVRRYLEQVAVIAWQMQQAEEEEELLLLAA